MKGLEQLSLIGVASGWGAKNKLTQYGPMFIEENFQLIKDCIIKKGSEIYLEKTIFPEKLFYNSSKELSFEEKELLILNTSQHLSKQIINSVSNKRFPIVIGGDHSHAIGTWNGVSSIYNCYEKLGLIWIDAHMDSHTQSTSTSKAIHGMPLAMLLGYGNFRILNGLFNNKKILNPENVVLIGIRSYEKEEQLFLKKLGVKVYYMDQVTQIGFKKIFFDSLNYLLKKTSKIGISLDLDAFDPNYIPATGSKEDNGILPEHFLNAMKQVNFLKTFVAFEIMEYNPTLDINLKTFNFIKKIITNSF